MIDTKVCLFKIQKQILLLFNKICLKLLIKFEYIYNNSK